MDLSSFALTERVAIVTGSGMGIGKAIALAFAKVGAHLVITDIDVPSMEDTAEQIRKLGRKALAIQTNVHSSEQVESMVQKAVDEFGRIDILVNNVGGSLDLRFPILEIREDDWDFIMAQNLKTVFLCSRAVGKIMIEQKKGNIINLASIAGLGAYPNNVQYGAAKAGVIRLTQSMASEWGPYNIRINAIAPGLIMTRALVKMGIPVADKLGVESPDFSQIGPKLIPLQRLGKPEDIAGAAIFLACDASDYVTGQTIVVSGGADHFFDAGVITLPLSIRKKKNI